MVIRKLARDPARLDALDLFRQLDVGSTTAVGDPERVERFLATIREPLQQALSTDSTVHGSRAQALFGSLVVALDGCELLLQLDSGEVFANGDDVKAGDFLVVLRDGRRLMVEVKSLGPRNQVGPLRLSAAEMAGLRRFADLIGAEPFVAGLFSALGEWALVPADAFGVDEHGRLAVDLFGAMQASEMNALGDVMLGVVPPVQLDLLPDKSEPRDVDADGVAHFTIGAAELRVGGELMVDDDERRLAMFLLRFNQWPGREGSEVDGRTLLRLSLVCEPEERSPGQRFEIIGRLSSMYTRWFDQTTRGPDGQVTSLQMTVEPGILPTLVPSDFKSARLPLWRFEVKPT